MFDVVSDVNRAGFFKIAKMVELPDFVKEAELTTVEDINGLRSAAFADSTNRKFPIHTAADTWLSWAYFCKHGQKSYGESEMSKIASKITEAAALWKVQLPRFYFEKLAAEAVKIKYVYRGQEKAATEVHSVEELEKIAQDLLTNRARYPYEMRRDAARQVLSAVTCFDFQFPINTERSLQKMAAYGAGTLDETLKVLQVRKIAVKDKVLSDKLAEAQDIVKEAAAQGLLRPDLLDKMASFVDAIDRLSDMHVKYNHGLQSPEEGLFSITVKDMDDLHKHGIKLSDGTLISDKEAKSSKIRQLLENLTGQKIAADTVVGMLKELNPVQNKLVRRVLA